MKASAEPKNDFNKPDSDDNDPINPNTETLVSRIIEKAYIETSSKIVTSNIGQQKITLSANNNTLPAISEKVDNKQLLTTPNPSTFFKPLTPKIEKHLAKLRELINQYQTLPKSQVDELYLSELKKIIADFTSHKYTDNPVKLLQEH